MDLAVLLFGLLKVSLDVFQGERRDRFLKQYLELEKEWQDEMSLPDGRIDDSKLDSIMLKCRLLSRLVISEHNNKE